MSYTCFTFPHMCYYFQLVTGHSADVTNTWLLKHTSNDQIPTFVMSKLLSIISQIFPNPPQRRTYKLPLLRNKNTPLLQSLYFPMQRTQEKNENHFMKLATPLSSSLTGSTCFHFFSQFFPSTCRLTPYKLQEFQALQPSQLMKTTATNIAYLSINTNAACFLHFIIANLREVYVEKQIFTAS